MRGPTRRQIGTAAALVVARLALVALRPRTAGASTAAPPGIGMVPETVEVYYTETAEAYKHLLDVLASYRSNTTTILAFATGATAFFGFANSHKGLGYVLALVSYGLAAVMAMVVFWPVKLQTNMAAEFTQDLAKYSPLSSTRARYLMTGHRQTAMVAAENAIARISVGFRALVILVALTVIAAGLNVALDQGSTVVPTHIVIDQPSTPN